MMCQAHPKPRRTPLYKYAVGISAVFAFTGLVILWILLHNAGYHGKSWKHTLATFAAGLAAIAGLLQATKAKEKSDYHRDIFDGSKAEAGSDLAARTANHLRTEHDRNAHHFLHVAFAWCVVLGGAVAGLVAEIIDFNIDV